MGKKSKVDADTNSTFDALFQAMTKEAEEKYPGQIYSGGAEAMRVVCLPMPAFAPRFLIQQEGWPLGRFYHLVGEQESCKSALGFEIMRWHGLMPGGGGFYFPTESKNQPELFRSIVGYEHPRMRWHDDCKTMQEWQAGVTDWIKRVQVAMDGTPKNPGPGRRAPVCWLVDSLMALLSDKENEKVDKQGHSDRHYAECAVLLMDFLKWATPEIKQYPFTLLGVNHLKPTKEEGPFGKVERNIPGGKAPKFFETMQIEMRRCTGTRPEKDIRHVKDDERGIEVEITIHKNSMAPHERIRVEMLWYTDYDDRDPAGHYRQKTFWDWYSASISILANLLKGDGKQAKRLREVIDLNLDTDTHKVWSPALGIDKKDKVPAREAGELLERKIYEDAAFRDALYAETGVRRRYLFKPHLDYQEQVKEAIKLAAGQCPEEIPLEIPDGSESQSG